MYKIEVQQIGDELGIILPDAVLSHLGVGEYDHLLLIPDENGYQLVVADPEVARQLAIAREGMRRYSGALKALAEGPSAPVSDE